MMNVLVIGAGGREHALAWKIKRSPLLGRLFVAPGNPGTAAIAEHLPLNIRDHAAIESAIRDNHIDLTVVGPEQPLADGLADVLAAHGHAVFGPSRDASALEWSKAFAKDFMSRHHIPTASYKVFDATARNDAEEYVARHPMPLVLKADGLAAGKGVLICRSRDEAVAAFRNMTSSFGEAGKTVVVEEFMSGEEASVFAITDGEHVVILPPAQDHKRALDGDQGKNTGGMGAYAPAPVVTDMMVAQVRDTIIVPTLRGMGAEGRPYRGCLYVGLMLTTDGPKVVEFNCRFGDPETQVVLPVLGSDLLPLLHAAATGTLANADLTRSSSSAVCVVLASGGYPDAYATGCAIRGIPDAENVPGTAVFHAGTRQNGAVVETGGGRVVGVTSVQPSLEDAIASAYAAVGHIEFDGMHYRKDIGARGLHHAIRKAIP